MRIRLLSVAAFAASLAVLSGPEKAFAQPGCLNFGPGLQLLPNPSPTATDIDGISDSTIVANMSSDFALLLMSQPGTYQLFASYNTSCPELSLGYQLAQAVAQQLNIPQAAMLDSLAVAVAASAVSNVNTFGFASTISDSAVTRSITRFGTQNFVNQVTTAIYNYRFTRATGPNSTYFFQFPADSLLVQMYQQYVSAQPYVNQRATEVQTGKPGAVHAAWLVTYKLSRANQSAYQAVSALYQRNGVPVYPGIWTDLFSIPRLSGDFLLEYVNTKVAESTTEYTSLPSEVGTPGTVVTTTYAPTVSAFISGPAQEQGLTTGVRPANVCIETGPISSC